MSEDIPSSVIQNPGEAYLEAQAVKNETTPIVQASYKELRKASPQNEQIISPLKDTGYLELGSDQLDAIKAKNPDYYFALMEQRDAIARFAATLKPSYSEIKSYMNPRLAQQQSEELPMKDQAKAEASAQQTAEATISFISRDLINKRSNNERLLDDTHMMDEVNRAIKKEMAEGHVIDKYYVRAPQIGALTEGIWATLEVDRQRKRTDVELVTDVTVALQKQKRVDQATMDTSKG